MKPFANLVDKLTGRSPEPGDAPRALPDAARAAVEVPRLDFAVVGAMKCGTTTLVRALSAHEDVFLPEREVHFFDDHASWLAVWRDGGIDPVRLHQEYGRHLETDRRLRGSKTPSYMASAVTLERLSRLHPLARVVVMLRDPVARAQSHWNHLVRARDAGRMGRETVSPTLSEHLLHNAWELERARLPESEISLHNVLHRGLYDVHLRNVHRFFPRDRILVGLLDDLRADTPGFLRRICTFLDVPYTDALVAGAARGDEARHAHHEALPVPVVGYLREYYTPSVRATEELIGRSLAHWLDG